MCRFVLYLGPEITLDVLTTRPANSIIHQSFQSRLRKEPLNGDGFGIAWYVPEVSPQPAQFRSIQPAWNNRNLLHLARVSRSPAILAHLRAATEGTRAVVSRYATGDAESPSLCTSTGEQCVCEEGVCRMIQGGDRAATVTVASEPLNDAPQWEPVPHNHMLLIRPDRSMHLRGIG